MTSKTTGNMVAYWMTAGVTLCIVTIVEVLSPGAGVLLGVVCSWIPCSRCGLLLDTFPLGVICC